MIFYVVISIGTQSHPLAPGYPEHPRPCRPRPLGRQPPGSLVPNPQSPLIILYFFKTLYNNIIKNYLILL